MSRFAFFLLIALLCSWNAPKAQGDDALPAQIQGNWAHPDCARGKQAAIFTRFFYLKSGKESLSLLPVSSVAEKKGEYWVLRFGKEERPVRIEDDGILKTGSYAKGSRKRPKAWDDLELEAAEEMTSCLEPPPAMPKTLSRLMRYIDRIREQCTVSVSNDCARVLFKLADADSNQKISSTEIKRAVTSALLFAELAERTLLTKAQTENLLKTAKEEGVRISDDLFSRYDADKSKFLDYNELMADFTAPALPIVRPTLEKAGLLLPSFKVVAMGLKPMKEVAQ